MKINKFLKIILLLITLQSCDKNDRMNFIQISGENNDSISEVKLKINQKFRLVREDETDINLSHSNRDFSDTLKVSEGYYDLIINDKTFLLYLENGYNLHLTINEDNIVIDGYGKKPNKYLQKRVELEKNLTSKNFYSYYSNLNESNFLNLADSIYNLRIDLIQKSELENSKLIFIEESLAKLDRAHKFLNYPFTRLQIDSSYSPSNDFPETFKDVDINDERLADVPHYSLLMFLKIIDNVAKDSIPPSDLAIRYLNFVLNEDLQVTNRKLKEEIAYKTITLTMDKTKSPDKLFEIYQEFSRDSIKLKEITDKYIKLKGLTRGSVAPNIAISNENGNLISLKEFQGKVLYINFWSTYCKGCLSEIEPSKELQKRLAKHQDIRFINININSNYDTWKKMISTKNIQGINLFANSEISKELKEVYLIQGTPRYVIVDKEGQIFDFSAKRPSNIKLEADLKRIL